MRKRMLNRSLNGGRIQNEFIAARIG